MSALHISISAEPVFHIGFLVISNSMLTSLVVTGLIVLFCLIVRSSLKMKGKPGRLQSFAELIIQSLLSLCEDITGSRVLAREFLPVVVAFFLFIILNNWLGLLPGVGSIGFRAHPGETESVVMAPVSEVHAKGPESAVEKTAATEGEFIPYFRAGTADLNTTIALALISVGLTQYIGFKHLGFSYIKKYINFHDPINFFVGILETVLEFAKIMSFAFRLFGNIFAGEVLLAVMTFLVPVIVPMPFYGLELFVGFIQALVFSMLSLVFFNLATLGHGEEH
ncbi:MAG: F0F1 ATP synthase subunit A [Candidatus Woesebacteria bacterium]